ncbi:tyrosine-protein phosphatase [Paenibacillus sp. PDC88]|uniref:tyrosine-protein phosphatase n=1 Tax=Paenibacillus TaxID=44249 RepID=UPI00089A121F|nr:tyrosine-protein phosphatase [Paenibacillus sp. PDC88]SDX82387.1 protein-tyrosine phosphatase [Paenibacillus sp. PDC88]
MSSLTHSFERRLQLTGAYNVRDLGGYLTRDGQTTRWGRFFRADGLHRLTENDRKTLLEKGVGTVIDLRHEYEVSEFKNVFTDSQEVAYHNVSLINPATTERQDINSLGELYVEMLDHVQPQLLRVFRLLAAEDGQAALFHCSAGKDRTGVTAALLLDLAGVPEDTIIADYALTGECIAPMIEELRKGKPDSVPSESFEKFLGSDPANMAMMLEHLDAKYGGAESYLASIGLTIQEIDALRSKLLEEI